MKTKISFYLKNTSDPIVLIGDYTEEELSSTIEELKSVLASPSVASFSMEKDGCDIGDTLITRTYEISAIKICRYNEKDGICVDDKFISTSTADDDEEQDTGDDDTVMDEEDIVVNQKKKKVMEDLSSLRNKKKKLFGEGFSIRKKKKQKQNKDISFYGKGEPREIFADEDFEQDDDATEEVGEYLCSAVPSSPDTKEEEAVWEEEEHSPTDDDSSDEETMEEDEQESELDEEDSIDESEEKENISTEEINETKDFNNKNIENSIKEEEKKVLEEVNQWQKIGAAKNVIID